MTEASPNLKQTGVDFLFWILALACGIVAENFVLTYSGAKVFRRFRDGLSAYSPEDSPPIG